MFLVNLYFYYPKIEHLKTVLLLKKMNDFDAIPSKKRVLRQVHEAFYLLSKCRRLYLRRISNLLQILQPFYDNKAILHKWFINLLLLSRLGIKLLSNFCWRHQVHTADMV